MLQIVIAEDHNIVRNGIKTLLEAEEDFNVVGEAKNGKEVLDIISKIGTVNLVLTDINMRRMDGISLIKEIKKINPNIRVVILSMLDSEKYISQAFTYGASGYLLKNIGSDELIFALQHVVSESRYLCSELSIKLLERLVNSPVPPVSSYENKIEFSCREIALLNLIAEGLTNLEISEKLLLSQHTIKNHRQRLIAKTGTRNTATLIRFAVLSEIIQ